MQCKLDLLLILLVCVAFISCSLLLYFSFSCYAFVSYLLIFSEIFKQRSHVLTTCYTAVPSVEDNVQSS